jgi:hypothetical protein
MTVPFIVYSLPRSRSAWIARFLSYGGRRCGHDLATECGSLDEFEGHLRGGAYAGTAETGAMIGWRALRRRLPEAKIAVIRRPVHEVFASLARFNVGPELEIVKQLIERDAMLDELARVPGVKSIAFSHLNSIDGCRALFEHCLGEPLDWEWWESLADVNIQVDVPERLRFQAGNRERIEAIKRQASEESRLPHIVLGPERWDAVWPEIDALFAEHFSEVEGELAANRPYNLDEPMMRAMDAAEILRIFTARVDGVLAGYCMWQVTRDVESAGMLIAQHGPWFVRKAYASLMLGPKLFDHSIADLRTLGVKNAFPHHRLNGRGAKLGTFFKRRGAIETQRTYSLWLGEPGHA